FGGLFPYVLPATNDPANSLTVANASSTEHTLTVMLVALAVLLPVVLAYTVWTYRVFRHRIADEDSPAPGEGLLEAAKQSYRRTFEQGCWRGPRSAAGRRWIRAWCARSPRRAGTWRARWCSGWCRPAA